MPRETLIQLRRGSDAEWSSVNPVLSSGEIAFDQTNNQIRVGDGSSSWDSLSPLGGGGGGGGEPASSGVEYFSFSPLPDGPEATETDGYVGLSMGSVPADFLTGNHSWWAAIRISRVSSRDDKIWSICDGGELSGGFGWRPRGDYFSLSKTSSYLLSCDNDTPAFNNIWVVFQWDDDTSKYDAWVDTIRELNQRTGSAPTSSTPSNVSWLRTLYSSNYFYNAMASVSAIVMGNGYKITSAEAETMTGNVIDYTDLDATVKAKTTHAWSFDATSVVTDLGGIDLTPETGGAISGFEFIKDTYSAPAASISNTSITLDNDVDQDVDLSALVTNRGGLSISYSKISGESWMGVPNSSGITNIDASGVTPSGYSGQYRITDGNSNTSDMTLTVTVEQAPTELFSEDWESGLNGWTIVDDPATVNKWSVGTAVSNGGSNSCYISNDAGVSHAYTTNDAGTVHVYKEFTTGSDVSGGVTLEFDWRADGESSVSNYDNLQVLVAPASTVPVGGSEVTDLYNVEGLSAPNWFNLNDTWSRGSVDISSLASSASTTYTLIFQWKNDGSGGSQSPAAIDNISILS